MNPKPILCLVKMYRPGKKYQHTGRFPANHDTTKDAKAHSGQSSEPVIPIKKWSSGMSQRKLLLNGLAFSAVMGIVSILITFFFLWIVHIHLACV